MFADWSANSAQVDRALPACFIRGNRDRSDSGHRNLRLQADAILLFFKARAFALAPDVKLSRLTEFLQKAISNCRRQRVALIFSRPLNSFDWRRQPTIDGGS